MSLRTSCKLLNFKNVPSISKYLSYRPVLFNLQTDLCQNCDKRLLSRNATRHDVREIYYGILTPQIKAVKIFSLTSSLVGIIAQPFLYKEIVSTGNVPIIIGAYAFIGFFTFLTPILLHLVTKKYITRLIYNEEKGTYTAQTISFFCTTKNTEFKPEEVTVPDISGMFTTFIAKRKPMFLDPTLFEYPEHYAKIMGFDKPMDFKLFKNSADAKQK